MTQICIVLFKQNFLGDKHHLEDNKYYITACVQIRAKISGRDSQRTISDSYGFATCHSAMRTEIQLSKHCALHYAAAYLSHVAYSIFFERVTYKRASTSYKVSVTRASISRCSLCRNRPTEQTYCLSNILAHFPVLSLKKKKKHELMEDLSIAYKVCQKHRS